MYRILFRSGSWWKYIILSSPSAIIEYYLERLGRPSYTVAGDLRSPGEDMEAKGVTEYLWDIIYVTWGVLGLVGVAGEWAWWLWVSAIICVLLYALGCAVLKSVPKQTIIPAYAIYLAFTTYTGMKNGMMPGMPSAPEGPPSNVATGAQSNRQKKAEKRGGQRIRYQ